MKRILSLIAMLLLISGTFAVLQCHSTCLRTDVDIGYYAGDMISIDQQATFVMINTVQLEVTSATIVYQPVPAPLKCPLTCYIGNTLNNTIRCREWKYPANKDQIASYWQNNPEVVLRL